LPFDLHRDEFQTTTTSPGLSTDDDEFDDDKQDHVDSENGGPDSAAVTIPSHSDAIPDLIPNPSTAADDVPDRGGSVVLENRLPSDAALHNGRSDQFGRSLPQKSRLLSALKSYKVTFITS